MDIKARVEHALEAAVSRAAAEAPPLLASAVRYAVFPGGARVRPRIALGVALACGDDCPPLTDAAATAIELLHCASLVHDDLPCFDDAAVRRGKPSVHCIFGEPIAVLAGDALIVLAFDVLARAGASRPMRLPRVLGVVAGAVGMPGGIVAGQAWESEAEPCLATYHKAKTGALFIGAAAAGALAAGADPAPWRIMGDRLGEAYQVADDLYDAAAETGELQKPIGQDSALKRPNAVRALGIDGALAHLRDLVGAAVAAVPPCAGAAELKALVAAEAKRLVPKKLAKQAA